MNEEELVEMNTQKEQGYAFGAVIQSLYSNMMWIKNIRMQELNEGGQIPVEDDFYNAINDLMDQMQSNFEWIVHERNQ